MKTEIMSVVWGQNYVQSLLDFALPSLLAPGNLPAWPWLESLSLQIWTTPSDAETIEAHPVWQKLKQMVQCHLHFLPDDVHSYDKYHHMNAAHQAAFSHAQSQAAALVMLMPDTLFCNGAFHAMAESLQAGPKDVILCVGPRLDGVKATPALHVLCQNNVLNVSPEKAVELLLTHPHPTTQGQFWGSDSFDVWTNYVYYWGLDGQLTIRTFHPHPIIFTRLYQPYNPTQSTVDGAFLQQYDSHRERVHLVQDSRVMLLSLTPTQDMRENVLKSPQPLSRKQVVLDRFRRHWCQPIHHWFFEQPIVLTPPPHLVQPAQYEVSQAIQSLQWFWQLEAAFHRQEQTAIQLLWHEKERATALPDVLRQAAQWYGQAV